MRGKMLGGLCSPIVLSLVGHRPFACRGPWPCQPREGRGLRLLHHRVIKSTGEACEAGKERRHELEPVPPSLDLSDSATTLTLHG